MDASNELYSVNLSTGAATLIGSTGIPALTGSWANSLSADGASLYYTEEWWGPRR